MIFAIEAVVDIAYHSSGQPVQSQEITRRQDIPRRYLEQALQQLVRRAQPSDLLGGAAATLPVVEQALARLAEMAD